MIKSENIAKLAKALVTAQKNMTGALKDAKNPFFKSNYADLGSVIDAALPSLNDQQIAVLQNATTVDGKAVMQTILLHESGEYIVASSNDIVCAKQNDPQAYGSAVSYARRYGLQSAVTLKSLDDDGEASMGRTQTIATPAKPAQNAFEANAAAKVTINVPELIAATKVEQAATPAKITVPKPFVAKPKAAAAAKTAEASSDGI